MEKETNGPTLQAILDLHEKIRSSSVPEPPRYNVYIHPDNPYLAEIRESRKRAETLQLDGGATERALIDSIAEEYSELQKIRKVLSMLQNAFLSIRASEECGVDMTGYYFRMHPEMAKLISGSFVLYGPENQNGEVERLFDFPVVKDNRCQLDMIYFMKDIQIGGEME